MNEPLYKARCSGGATLEDIIKQFESRVHRTSGMTGAAMRTHRFNAYTKRLKEFVEDNYEMQEDE